MFSKLTKPLTKVLGKNTNMIVLGALAVAAIYFLTTYSCTKKEGFEGEEEAEEKKEGFETEEKKEGFSGLSPQGVNESGMMGVNAPGMSAKAVVDPAELMPKDTNSEWARLNPHGSSDLAGVSSLDAGHHIGVNTVSSSLRNANLQLRSEPANPRTNVGPWMNSTIEGDPYRRELEIGN
jgi:hypothetical protein